MLNSNVLVRAAASSPWKWLAFRVVFGTATFWTVAFWAAFTTRVLAEDTVVLGEAGGKTSRASGEILDFTGRELTLRTRSGRESRIPFGRVRDVQTSWPAGMTKADEHFQKHAYREAAAEYVEAYKVAKREWVKRRILAKLTWCYRSTKSWRKAAQAFHLMLKSDAHSQDFQAIPLAWRTQQPSLDMETISRGWLSEGTPVERLIAASWLIPTRQRAEAIAVLQELEQDQDTRIAQLAKMQQWRTKIVSVRQEDLDRWRSAVRRLPPELRAGPYYLLGQASSRLGLKQDAILAYLREPINYPQNRRLAGEALLLAGREYVGQGDPATAIRLYREALQFDDDGELLPVVESRLEQLRAAAAGQ